MVKALPTWAELHEREPGLRPLPGEHLGHFENQDSAKLSYDMERCIGNGCGLVRDVHMPGWYLNGEMIPDAAFDALCRDRAVAWLTSQQICVDFAFVGGSFPCAVKTEPNGYAKGCGNWYANTLDEALRAAVGAVLDARVAATP